MTMVSETGWLIEHRDTTFSIRYLTLHPYFPGFWTTDHLLAIRFARKKDAEDFQNYFGPLEGDGGKVVEHAWDVVKKKSVTKRRLNSRTVALSK